MKRFALWLVLAAGSLAGFAFPALAYTPVNLQWLTPYGDGFWNYDFDTDEPLTAYADWPVAPVWRSWTASHATVSYVKNYIRYYLGPGYPETGSSKYSQVYDGSTDWDVDGGRLTDCYYEYGNGKKRHIRVYAPNGYQFYNPTWGYYVISNVHAPHWYSDASCSGGADAWGWSEDYEGIILGEAAADGYSTYPYLYATQNASDWWEDATHYQKSNGYASRVTL